VYNAVENFRLFPDRAEHHGGMLVKFSDCVEFVTVAGFDDCM